MVRRHATWNASAASAVSSCARATQRRSQRGTPSTSASTSKRGAVPCSARPAARRSSGPRSRSDTEYFGRHDQQAMVNYRVGDLDADARASCGQRAFRPMGRRRRRAAVSRWGIGSGAGTASSSGSRTSTAALGRAPVADLVRARPSCAEREAARAQALHCGGTFERDRDGARSYPHVPANTPDGITLDADPRDFGEDRRRRRRSSTAEFVAHGPHEQRANARADRSRVRPRGASSERARRLSSGPGGLEPELRGLRRHLGRIVAGQARAAERRGGTPRRRDEAVVRDVRERRRADVLAHLLDRLRRWRSSRPDRRGRCRRSTGRSTGGDEMRTCTSVAPASKSICTICSRRVAAHDRVVDDDDALARDLGERVELQPDRPAGAAPGRAG